MAEAQGLWRGRRRSGGEGVGEGGGGGGGAEAGGVAAESVAEQCQLHLRTGFWREPDRTGSSHT